MMNAQLDRANLTSARMRGTWLHFASLVEADLSGADLRGVRLERVNLAHANLTRAVVSREALVVIERFEVRGLETIRVAEQS